MQATAQANNVIEPGYVIFKYCALLIFRYL